METELTLDEIVSFEKTYSFSRSIEGEGEYRHIHYGDIHTKLPSIIENSEILPEITEEDNFKVIQKGDILVADASEDYKDLGKAVCYMGDDEKVIAGLHTHLLRCNKEMVNPEYLINLFQTNRYKKFVWRMGTGVSVLGLSKNNLGKYEIFLPTLEEQKKKANFFNILNKKIQLQQQKIDLLQEKKKGFLQKMFPRAGETQPEMRFNGFTGDWEHRELEDYFTERSERSSSGELISVTIKLGVIRAADLERRDSSSENKSNYKVVKVGDIAYNSMRMWQGASGYSPYEGILSPAYTVIKPKEDVDTQFFAYMFKRYDMIQTFKKNSQGLTSDTWNLKFPTLKRIKVNVPHYEEQRRIAEFFKQLDNTIALQQQKLDIYNEQKKGFIQQMFI